MRQIKENTHGISTILAFALIPISGFATDIFIPSLPAIAKELHVSSGAVQLSVVLFMFSSGLSQLFVGSLLDSFGRYKLGIAAIIAFSTASFVIGLFPNIYLIYAMRIIQGMAVALIVVGKRAYFIDVYSGESLKQYTSLFSIVWATAPIIAPFIGGYLQALFGWESNFYFLGIFTVILLVLELRYSGESLKIYQPFKIKEIIQVYSSTIKTADFSIGLIMIALSYSALVVYGMSSPFIIEHIFHYSSVVTGYCSLLSGVSLMSGGIISKIFIKKAFKYKLAIAVTSQTVASLGMYFTAERYANLFSMMAFTAIVHLLSGFIFNNFFAYCLGRFSRNAGIVSGITGGALYILTSIISYSTVNLIFITNQKLLAGAFFGFAFLSCIFFRLFVNLKGKSTLVIASS